MFLNWSSRFIHSSSVNIGQCVEGCRRLDVHGGGQRPGSPDTRTIEGLDLKGKPWPLGRAVGLGLMSRHFQNAGLVLTRFRFQIPVACFSFLSQKSFRREAKQIPESSKPTQLSNNLAGWRDPVSLMRNLEPKKRENNREKMERKNVRRGRGDAEGGTRAAI